MEFPGTPAPDRAPLLPGEDPANHPPPAANPAEQTRRWSWAGRLTASLLLVLLVMASLAAAATQWSLSPWLTFLAILVCGLPLGAWLISRLLRPLDHTLQGLKGGISALQDRDFSVRLRASRPDELGDLCRLYNAVGDVLQQERHEVRQKELLLATALNRSPAAVILINALDRVVYSNAAARQLLLGGAKLDGNRFAEIRDRCPKPMQEILRSDGDGLFTVPHADPERVDTYHLAQRSFLLNRRRHTLILLHRMTGELGRQEAEVWKRVIRVICHELNNSLAPVSSLVHSAQTVTGMPEYAARLAEIFTAIEDRIGYLTRFIEGYARFARLPKPRRELVYWSELLASAAGDMPNVDLDLRSTQPGYFDQAQMHQVILNLLKNAVEASADGDKIQVRVLPSGDGGTYVQVLDRGSGMPEETMKRALLPFYSTKPSGTGLGLPLCREIIEAHGGRIELRARGGGGTAVTCWLPGKP